MKIILILTEFPPSIGGMQTHALLLSKMLYKLGHDIKIITYRPDHDTQLIEKFDKTLNFKVERILSRIGFFNNLDILEKQVKDFSPDIIYSSTIFYGLLKTKLDIPIIARSVGNDIQRPWIVYPFKFGAHIAGNPWLDTQLYKLFKKLNKPQFIENIFKQQRLQTAYSSAKKLDLILANSDYTRQLLIDIGVNPKKIWVLPGGVDFLWFKKPNNINKRKVRQNLGLPVNQKIILTACRLVEKKGLNELISLMSILPKNLSLVIVGDGKLRKNLLKLRNFLQLNQRIIFTGPIEYEKMREYYWVSDLFVLGSKIYKNPKTGLIDAETMGRVLCEANAAGLPVIASDSGGIPSIITNDYNGLLFKENDYQDLYEKIIYLLKHKKLQQYLITGGLYRAKHEFDWEWILKAHFKAFLKVLNQKKDNKINELYKPKSELKQQKHDVTSIRST